MGMNNGYVTDIVLRASYKEYASTIISALKSISICSCELRNDFSYSTSELYLQNVQSSVNPLAVYVWAFVTYALDWWDIRF